ncbi:hypothetical protein [Halapricum hydrolyticum]|uniref:Uncharacterized protein n=1 Tax=Halapricum hydrolyticum TaxID=2979991 RepID=A0AAE3IAE5_9EURY|nr:hypothetical protein [Halapricum hydrolyticum]MCU4717580.1 hypothetical protein [Halapricum hydrolyticum]MCU4726891.1 hypothetical protein [Halapricum hydrolyticum]
MSLLADQRPWDDEVVRTYLTATAQQKDDPKTFYNTHLDIDRIYAKFLPRYQDEFVTQEQFRDELVDSPIDADIRTFIVRGETGSGKSQLCQWLDYELAGKGESEGAPDRIPLHIKANQTNIEHIISTLAEPLGEDPEIRQVTELDAEKVADAIVRNLVANPGQKLADANIDRIIQEGNLESMLASNIQEYQNGLYEGDETDFDPNLISKEDYRDIALSLGTDSVFHNKRQVLRQALRDEIHRHFSHVIGVDDFQGQLRDYAQRYVEELDKRPVIICEDVTTFSVLKEQLLDQIIQVESATYDIVLGYTTGFEQDDLQDALSNRGNEDALTYLQDRSEGYLSLTQDGVAYFLDNSLSVDLVHKYMDVIKRESGAEINESTESAFDGLYPFNRAFVQMAYDHLLEDGSPRRTPRVLLQKVVRRVLLSDDPPYEVVDKNPNVDNQVTPIDPGSYSNQMQKLATWYGYRDEVRDDSSEILIHRGVLEAFEFDTDGEGTVDYEGANYVAFHPNEAATRILGNADNSRPSIPASEESESEITKTPGTEKETKTEIDKKEKTKTKTKQGGEGEDTDRRENQINDFLEWVETGDSYPSSEVLRSGAESVLGMWHDPTKLGNTNSSRDPATAIYYTRGEKVPVSIEGPDERDGLSVMLPFGKEYMDLYFELLEVGMNEDGELPESATVEQLRSWATNSVVGFRQKMRKEIEDDKNGMLPPGLTIEHTILLGKLLLSNAEFGTTEFDREAIFDRQVPRDREYESPIREALSDESSLRSTLGGLKDRRRDIEGLVDGFFLLKKNLVDHDRLDPVRKDIASDPDKYLQLAQQIDTEKLDYPSAYNIGTSRSSNKKTSVVTFLNSISDYAIELSRLSDEDLESHFESALDPIQQWHDPSHRADEIESMLDTLIECLGMFGVTKLERWENVQQELHEKKSIDLTTFNESISSFVELEAESPLERVELLHEFQASKEDHITWEVYRTFDEIIEELSGLDVSESSDLRTQIQELNEVTEYESARSDVINAVNSY